jgi:hypothetical protein
VPKEEAEKDSLGKMGGGILSNAAFFPLPVKALLGLEEGKSFGILNVTSDSSNSASALSNCLPFGFGVFFGVFFVADEGFSVAVGCLLLRLGCLESGFA